MLNYSSVFPEFNLMKNISCFVLSFLITVYCADLYAQTTGYIITDSTITLGATLIPGTPSENALYILEDKNGDIIKHLPSEVAEYGISKGSSYFSKNLLDASGENKKVFLELLVKGKINLYYFDDRGNDRFFLERDSTLFVEVLEKNDFQNQLKKYTEDFDWKLDQTKLVKYNRESISKFISMYNQRENGPFPISRFGLMVSANTTFLNLSSTYISRQLGDMNLMPNYALSIGAFGYFPIEKSNYALNVGVNIIKNAFSVQVQTDQYNRTDLIVNLITINAPVYLQYTYSNLNWRPYTKFGGIYSYHVKNENASIQTRIDGDLVTIYSHNRNNLLANIMGGFSLGFGFERNITYKRIIGAEIRFNQFYGAENTAKKSQLEILFSLSF